MKEIWIVGLNNTYNLGDPLLLVCVQDRLQAAFPDCRWTIVNVTGTSAQKPYQVPSAKQVRTKHRKFRLGAFTSALTPLSHIRTVDRLYESSHRALEKQLACGLQETLDRMQREKPALILFGGGEMFLHSFLLPIREILRQCSTSGIPVLFHACGFGPVISPRLRSILTDILTDPAVRQICVRDYPVGSSPFTLSLSRHNLRQITRKRKQKLSYAADMGLWASEVYHLPSYKNHAPSTNAIKRSSVVGLGVVCTPLVSMQQEIRLITGMIRLLEEQKRPWQLFTNGYPDDEFIAREILRTLKISPSPGGSSLLFVPHTPSQLAEYIASCHSIISCRLHSHIIAASCGVPAVALSWDAKLPQFFQRAGCPQRCLSFRSRPEEVLHALQEAEEHGWDQAIIHTMREESLARLAEGIHTVTD